MIHSNDVGNNFTNIIVFLKKSFEKDVPFYPNLKENRNIFVLNRQKPRTFLPLTCNANPTPL